MTKDRGQNFYITTAIPYMNAKVHIGNCLEYVLADTIARAARLLGRRTRFLTGTDEHGQKIFTAAQKKKVQPQTFVDDNAAFFQATLKDLKVSHDDFIRTSDRKRHWPVAQAFWQRLVKAGDIYQKEYAGRYCVGCEAFIKESDLDEYGHCPIHHKPLQSVKEQNYFFRLSKYEKPVREFIQRAVVPRWRAAEMLNIVNQGLEDISFSRPCEKLPWGIPVPGDDSQVIYVWCDALVNYLSAISTVERGELQVGPWWPADVQVIGKDIAKFHTIYWPAMLTSAGLELPRQILIHGFLTVEGQKISKSLGNVIQPQTVINKFGLDPFRYYYLKEIPTFDDGDFSESRLRELTNNDLADTLGNLLQRVLVMANKYEVEWSLTVADASKSVQPDSEVLSLIVDKLDPRAALAKLIERADQANKKIQQFEPWELIKSDPDRARAIIGELLNELAIIALTLAPFLPETAAKIQLQLTSRQPQPLFVKSENK